MNNRIALGIDISESRISMALLKRTRNGAKVLKAGFAPVPEGAINDGNIENSEELARAIKDLKSQLKIHERRAAISLPVESTITQILDAPKGAPINIGQYVQKELKSYIVLSGIEIAFDYCGIQSSSKSGERILAVAADQQRLASIFRTCTRTHLNVEVIEPSILAYIRALYSEKIEAKYDSDVLIAILQGTVLTLCVFRKQTFDFIRVEHAVGEQAEPDGLCQWISDRINTIIKFYEMDVADSSGTWEIAIVSDNAQLPDDAQEFLSSRIAQTSLEVRTSENACQDNNINQTNCKGKTSAPAIGLAMRLLDVSQTNLQINLIPKESKEVKAIKKQLAFTVAIIVIAIPLLLRGVGIGLNQMAESIQTRISNKKKIEISKDTYASFQELTNLNQQIKLLSKRPTELKEILSSRAAIDWAKVFKDIKSRTPNSVRITDLNSTRDSGIVLKGMALSYEAARMFEKSLNESEYINFANLAETEREESVNSFIVYKINCSLNTEKIKI